MKDCILFLNGSYSGSELVHYAKLAHGKFTVAVDGGFAFFRKTKTFPDLLIGDFDSIKSIPRNLPSSTLVKRYPVQKDKTDAELALEYCLDSGTKKIDIVQPSYGEPDQLLGNFLLLSLVVNSPYRKMISGVRILNRLYEVLLLHDSSLILHESTGDLISIIPISDMITLSTQGMAYEARKLQVSRGRSLGMRNVVAKARARVAVVGTALLVHQFELSRKIRKSAVR